MTATSQSLQNTLSRIAPFDLLPGSALSGITQGSQMLRYRIGQPIVRPEALPQLVLITEGQARLLGEDPRTEKPITLKLLEKGDMLGVVGMLRGKPCETAIASSEVVGLKLSISAFQKALDDHPNFAAAIRDRLYLAEVFDLLARHIGEQAQDVGNLAQLAHLVHETGVVRYLPFGQKQVDLDSEHDWFVSSGTIINQPMGSRLNLEWAGSELNVISPQGARLVGLPEISSQPVAELPTIDDGALVPTAAPDPREAIPFAPEHLPEPEPETSGTDDYPFVRGRGEVEGMLACMEMVSLYFGMPFRRDIIRRILTNQRDRLGQLSLPLAGKVAEFMGLRTQMTKVPASAVGRVPTPALISWQEGYALLYETNSKTRVLAIPETGIIQRSALEFEETWGGEGEILLIEKTRETPQERFGLSWFIPSLQKYRWVLVEVLIASFFVQLFGLANPLMVQVIIDKVIVQNSTDTLQVLGVFLLVIAVFEAVLTALRTYLFVDTTNRIDMALGTEIIDHLLRLPLRYFDRRPVGELSSRVNELENIRKFLTGTALTVVLDAVFSVLYIVVMFIYSWLLTLVALATIPLFVFLTVLVAPVVRRQLRQKAERNAATQSYLVEALSGIQTVKAQNIELRTRWQWQERYASYVSAGFNTVLTSTTAGAASSFLNKLSALLVLWVGAYLVLQGELSLGQLIAFRIISGYVTAPILRLAQLWQNFQETALSLERLSDILDHPCEAEEQGRNQIQMPDIQGIVRYENVAFRFAPSGPLQLVNINLEFPAGEFVGIVGQSGSGKSTLMKLLPRLYEIESGRILIDKYDISKVELYSLRQQVGIVPQDSLLFEGTVQDNISLTRPEADTEAIIEAARIACAHEFIMDLPLGYNTRVGERGSSLSGGQRQRIAIARTILHNPRLLILDEATSALDYDTEKQVCTNLKAWSTGRTVFFITHRLSTIQDSDTILVMDKGAAVEQGSHEELMDIKGRYYTLYQQQIHTPE
ncbi:peptidase domain-containing ABC transporter [Oscillatoria sp. CS-180]|uniref:peptidase domain-containing ABC transporter n=1 Tax=Oscillatoria sp. CS-180 TaxID=3021720 RepID=UPI00232FEAC7|nr:peptidase domain-containing ABC transporter [Oscillatoria sp. CS-180]MDB9525038.1 peptidase domain-containing ABC transporter [Oscillatoria sp. CS-180]